MRSCWITLVLLSTACGAGVTWGQGPGTAAPTVGLRNLTPDAYALENAEIIVQPGTIISGGTVLIRNGSIIAVGKDVDIPAGTKRIDHSGHHVYAGLIDAFSEAEVPHPDRDAGAPHWNGNVMPQRSAAQVAGNGVMNAAKLRSQGITLRLVAPQGAIIKGTSCLVLCGDGDSGQLLVRDVVWHHLSLTVPRQRSGAYPNSPMGATALLRQSILDARWYAEAQAAYRANPALERPETDSAFAALGNALETAVFVVDAPNERMAQRADTIAKEMRLNIILRGSGREYRQLAEIAAGGHAILVPVDFPDAPKIDNANDARVTPLVDLLDWQLAPTNPARLADAGVTFCLTTDGLDDPSAFLKQVRQAVRAGLDADQALAAITVHPARLLGVDDWAGTVQPGRLANLVITDGDLFAEKTKTLETWVAGKRYEVTKAENEHLDAIAGCWDITFAADDLQPVTDLRMELKMKDSSLGGKLSKADAHASPENAADAQPPAAGAVDDATDDATSDEEDSDEDDESEDDDAEDNDAEDDDAEDDDAEDKQVGGAPVAEMKQLVRERDRLSAAVDLSQVDETFPVGVSWLSLVTVTGEQGELIAQGTLRLPDGQLLPITVKRTGDTCSGDAANETSDSDGSDDDPAEKEPAQDETSGEDEPSIDVVYPLGAYGLSEPPAARPLVMFRGATLWTCGPQGVIETGDVLVRNGRIEAVGASLETPEGCEVIDVTGKHITPGLIDCHSHIATDGGVNESGQAITAEVRIGDFIDCSDIAIYRQLAGGLTTSNILHGSANPIGGQNQVIKLRWGASMDEMRLQGAPQGIKFALGENVKRTAGRYPDTRMGVEQIIRDQLLAAGEYRATHRRYRDGDRSMLPPRVDLQLESLAEVLEGTRWVHCHSYRQDEILALLDVLDEFDIQIGSLQHILEGYKVADRMRAAGAMASSFSDWWAYKFEVYDAIPYNGALMHDNGIVVSFNSDDAELARHLNTEAAKAVKYGGVPAAEALKFVTLNPARQLRIDDRVGSLEAGKDADLVVWSRQPLSTMTRCEQTWIDGRCYFSLQQDAQLRERDAQLHARLVQKILADDATPVGARKPRVEEEDRWHRHDIYCGHHGHDHHDIEAETNQRISEELQR